MILAKIWGFAMSRDFDPLQLRNGPKSQDVEKQSVAPWLVPARPV
jgi:hypothetical protein